MLESQSFTESVNKGQNEKSEELKQQEYDNFLVKQDGINELKKEHNREELLERRAELDAEISMHEANGDYELAIDGAEELAKIDEQLGQSGAFKKQDMQRIENAKQKMQNEGIRQEQAGENSLQYEVNPDQGQEESIGEANNELQKMPDTADSTQESTANDAGNYIANAEGGSNETSRENAGNSGEGKEKMSDQTSQQLAEDIRKTLGNRELSPEKKREEILKTFAETESKFEGDYSEVREKALSFIDRYEEAFNERNPNEQNNKLLGLAFGVEANITDGLRKA